MTDSNTNDSDSSNNSKSHKHSPGKNLSQVLAELKSEYLQKLPKKIELLNTLTQEQNWVGLEQEYHNLKGNGKTYGYPELSLVGEKLEFLCQNQDTQILNVFEDAITLLTQIYQDYGASKPIDLLKNPIFISLMKVKSQTENQWLQKAHIPPKKN